MRPTIIFSTYDSLGNPYYNGGGADAVHEVAKRLTKQYQVIVIAGFYKGAKDHTLDKVKYLYIGIAIHPLLDQLFFHFASLVSALTRRYDLWIESFTPPVALGLISRLSHRPVIGLVHMLPAADMERKYHLPLLALESWGLRGYSHLIVTSRVIAKQVYEASPRTTVNIIANGVERHRLSSRKPRNFVYLGRIEIDQKGLDLLVQAYLSTPSLHRYPLVIVGSGQKSEVQQLRDLIQGHPQIKYLEPMYGKAKASLLSSARAVIVPSRFETFSLLAAEAIAHQIPLVTFTIPGLSWIPRKLRYVAPRLTARSLATTIASLSSNYQEAESRAKRAFTLLKPSTWTQVSEQYSQFIQKVIYG